MKPWLRIDLQRINPSIAQLFPKQRIERSNVANQNLQNNYGIDVDWLDEYLPNILYIYLV